MRDIIIITVWTIIFSIIMLFTMIYVHNTPRDIRRCEMTTLLAEYTAMTTAWEVDLSEECSTSKTHIVGSKYD